VKAAWIAVELEELVSADHAVPQVVEEDSAAVDSDSECCCRNRPRRVSVGVDWCDPDEGLVVQPGSN